MKFVLIADTHFGVRNDSHVIKENQKRFYDEIFFPYLKKHGLKNIIHLGDVFDRRKYINFNTLHEFKKLFFSRLESMGIEMTVAVGNHDTYYRNTNEVNSLELLLEEYESIHVIKDKPYEFDLQNSRRETALIVPWLNPENTEDTLSTMKNTKSRVCFGHFEIEGFEVLAGMGHVGGLSANLFNNFEQVFSGHFHVPSSNNNITYLGSPYHMTWGDVDDRSRGFYVYDSETGDLEHIGNPISPFRKFYYDDKEMDLETLDDIDLSDFTNSYLRLIVKNKGNPYLFDLLVEKFQAVGVVNMKIIDEAVIFGASAPIQVDGVERTQDIITQYIDNSSTNLNKEDVKNFMIELYTRALSHDNYQEG